MYILYIFLPFSHMPTIWGGFRQMIRCGVSTKGAEEARLAGSPTYTLEESRKRLEAIYQRG